MANYIGAIRFLNGDLRWFSYQGTTDIARRALFIGADDVTHQQDYLPATRSAPDEEEVEVMPYYEHGSFEVAFMSRASRSLMAITGPVSRDEAMHEVDTDSRGAYGV